MPDSPTPRAVVPVWRWWAGFFVVVGVGFTLSGVAYHEGLPGFLASGHIDKVLHCSIAGLLAFFLDGALKRRSLFEVFGLAIPAAAALILVPVGIEEYLQRYSDYRSSSVFDFLADVVGVAAFIPLSRRAAR